MPYVATNRGRYHQMAKPDPIKIRPGIVLRMEQCTDGSYAGIVQLLMTTTETGVVTVLVQDRLERVAPAASLASPANRLILETATALIKWQLEHLRDTCLS